jgi:hypothetical protein
MNVDDVSKKIKKLNEIKKLLKIAVNENDSVEEVVFKKYLHLESISKVAAYLNEHGYKNKNRKYIAQDISFIITNKDVQIKNKQLKDIVIKIFNNHKKGINKPKW